MKLPMLFMIAVTLCACGGSATSAADKAAPRQSAAPIGSFDRDSAYAFVAKQVSFGPRVPGTEPHRRCGDYLTATLHRLGADTVIEQTAVVEAFNGDKLPIKNIFAKYNSEALNRILLVAHWDTRPWASMESSEDLRMQPVPGANDGASGVGVILEIARNLQLKSPGCGVDILLTDAEDYGNSGGFVNNDDTWCLGTQYWVQHMPYNTVNRPSYGILLDMVGGEGARFHREYMSHKTAKVPTVKVWAEAKNLGYDDIFINRVGGAVTDDHVFLTAAGIPTTDIIEHMSESTGNFPVTWHTLSDDMQHISAKTLGAVGTTVLNVIYKEKEL